MVKIKNVRLKDYDYKENGYYFVTIISSYRQNLLLGKEILIKDQLNDLISKVSGLSVDYFVVMPNHIHLILILESSSLPLGEIVRRFKARVAKETGEKIWQPNYYEHVIRNETALNKIREYIINNPDVEILKFEQFYI